MHQQGLGAQGAEFFQARHHAQAVLFKRVLLIGQVFGAMDVQAGPVFFSHGHRGCQGIVVHREGSVQADHGADQPAGPLLQPGQEPFIFGDPFPALFKAVGSAQAKGGADADLFDRLLDDIENAALQALGFMVIDDGRGAVPDAGDQRDQGRIINVLGAQGVIELPPELFQDLVEISGRGPGNGHAAGEGRVQVVVAVDETGHDDPFFGVDDPGPDLGAPGFEKPGPDFIGAADILDDAVGA